jgi:cobalt-zinc-cadmium efflux system outer membrane protein
LISIRISLLNHFIYRAVLCTFMGAVSSLVVAEERTDSAQQSSQNSQQLSLQEALSLARERNYDVKLSRSAVRAAAANLEIAGAAPNPILSTQASSINPARGIGGGSIGSKSIDTTIRIDQLIERGGKRELRQENAQYLESAARADNQDFLRQLERQVTDAYVDLMAAQDRVKTSLESAKILDNILDAAQIRKDAGDISGAELERIKVDTLRVRNDLALAQGELARARNALALLLGDSSPAAVFEATDAWPAFDAANSADQIKADQIILSRADVLAANERLQAAKIASQYAQSLRTRDVTVGLQMEHYPQGDLTGRAANTVGIALQIPLFVRYYYKGEILTAEANLDSANDNLNKTRAIALSEIQLARFTLQSTVERVRRNHDELLPAAEKSAKAAEFAYLNGAASVMDVLDARRTLRSIRIDALSSLVDYSKAVALWRAATTTISMDANANASVTLHSSK